MTDAATIATAYAVLPAKVVLRQFDVSPWQLRRIGRKHRIGDRRTALRASRNAAICRAYEGDTVAVIAARFGLAPVTVEQILREAGMKLDGAERRRRWSEGQRARFRD